MLLSGMTQHDISTNVTVITLKDLLQQYYNTKQ